MKTNSLKTTTLTAQVAVTKMESGMDHVQVLPDDPRVGQVEAFRGLGYGQMLSTGSFEFTRHKIVRSQAKTLLKLPHSSIPLSIFVTATWAVSVVVFTEFLFIFFELICEKKVGFFGHLLENILLTSTPVKNISLPFLIERSDRFFLVISALAHEG